MRAKFFLHFIPALLLTAALILTLSACCITIPTREPTYTASFTIYIQNQAAIISPDISTGDLATSKEIVYTYIEILKSNSILEPVIEASGCELTPAQLRDILVIESVNETNVLTVSVTTADPQTCLTIAQAMADIVPERIAQIITGSSVKLIDIPKVTENKFFP